MIRKFIFILAIATTSACVPAKKYDEAQKASKLYREQKEECKVETDLLKKRVSQLESEVSSLTNDNHVLGQDTTLYGMKNRTLLNQLAILENDLRALAARMGNTPEYEALMRHLLQMQDELVDSEGKRLDTEKAIEKQKRALAETESALAESEAALARNNQELLDKEQEILNKNTALQQKNSELADAQRNIEAQAARLREMEAALQAKDSAMANLRNKIASALVDFNSDDLTVNHKNGKVYVSLEEKLLFESGKYDVNSKGVEALKKIASVLALQSGLEIVIEGHTDNVPYSGPVIIDNWDLSAKRATSVLRILLANGNFSKNNIQACGRGDTCPIETNSTADGRRKNRRTEIILAPNLDQIIEQLK